MRTLRWGGRASLGLLLTAAALAVALLVFVASSASVSGAPPLMERHGQLVVVSPAHPDAARLVDIRRNPGEQFGLARGLTEVQGLGTPFATQAELPGGFRVVYAIGAVGDRGWAEAGIEYRGGDRIIQLFQMIVGDRDFHVLDPGPDTVEARVSFALADGTLVWGRVPASTAAPTNPRQLRWVAGGVLTTLTAIGFEDLDSVQALVAEIRSQQTRAYTQEVN